MELSIPENNAITNFLGAAMIVRQKPATNVLLKTTPVFSSAETGSSTLENNAIIWHKDAVITVSQKMSRTNASPAITRVERSVGTAFWMLMSFVITNWLAAVRIVSQLVISMNVSQSITLVG